MDRRLLTILALAFVIASGCSYLVWQLMKGRAAGAQTAATTRFVAAAGDIKLGTVLQASNLKTIEIVGPAPKGAILKPENAIGRGVLSDLYEGEPILENRLAVPGTGGGLASIIPKGMRACAVKVDDVVGLAGFVTPGMRVDVLVSGIPPANGGASAAQGTVTKTVLQNIQVLSAGTDYQKDAEGKAKPVQVVNLLVTPEQAETLSLASSQERIQLVLRNPLDTSVDKIPATAMSTLFNGDAAPVVSHPVQTVKVVRKPAPNVVSIEIINGSKRSQEKIASPEEKQ